LNEQPRCRRAMELLFAATFLAGADTSNSP
jgi:hypothetical protein